MLHFDLVKSSESWCSKGQLISKCLFGAFNSSKKRTKNFGPSRLGQKFEFSRLFFGRIEDTKISFRDYLTFSSGNFKPNWGWSRVAAIVERETFFCIWVCWRQTWRLGRWRWHGGSHEASSLLSYTLDLYRARTHAAACRPRSGLLQFRDLLCITQQCVSLH